MSGCRDKIILKCLRCRKNYNILVNDFVRGKCRRCPDCGGEMDCSGFEEWVKQGSEKMLKLLDERRNRLQENPN